MTDARRRRRRPRPIVLVVLDGFGIGRDPAADADRRRPDADLARPARALAARACSARPRRRVGLPPGQMGNSEVGPPEPRRRPAGPPGPAADRRRDRRRLVLRAPGAPRRLRRAPPSAGGRLHVVSLIGPGGVHANDRHLVALAELAAPRAACRRVRVHALLDGRDTPPRSALGFVADLERAAGGGPPGRRGSRRSAAATSRWTATSAGSGSSAATTRSSTGWASRRAPSATAAIEAAYARGENDEFVAPTVIDGVDGRRPRRRPDRPRQLPGRPGAPADPRPRRRTGVRRRSTGRRRPAARPRPTCSS